MHNYNTAKLLGDATRMGSIEASTSTQAIGGIILDNERKSKLLKLIVIVQIVFYINLGVLIKNPKVG